MALCWSRISCSRTRKSFFFFSPFWVSNLFLTWFVEFFYFEFEYWLMPDPYLPYLLIWRFPHLLIVFFFFKIKNLAFRLWRKKFFWGKWRVLSLFCRLKLWFYLPFILIYFHFFREKNVLSSLCTGTFYLTFGYLFVFEAYIFYF